MENLIAFIEDFRLPIFDCRFEGFLVPSVLIFSCYEYSHLVKGEDSFSCQGFVPLNSLVLPSYFRRVHRGGGFSAETTTPEAPPGSGGESFQSETETTP